MDVHWTDSGPTGPNASAPPLVLLHGLGDTHRTWSKLLPILTQTRRVLAPDLCGHGLSGRPDADYSIDWHARVIAQWIAQRGIEEVDVVGHSYGGGVAQWLLRNPKNRVRKLGLVAAGGLGRDVNLALRLAAMPWVVERVGQPFMATGTFVALQAAIRGVYSTRELVELSLVNGRSGTARAFARTVRDVIDLKGQRRGFYQHERELERIPPVGLFWGDDDPIIPVEHGITASRLIPGGTLYRFARCGHYPHRERPGSFVDALETFLRAETKPVESTLARTG